MPVAAPQSESASHLRLVPPGTPLWPMLLDRLERAVRAGERVWYLAPDPGAGRARRAELARRVAVADAPVGPLRELVLRALAAAGEDAAGRGDPRVAEGLLGRALQRVAAGIPAGAGRSRAAQAALEALLAEGWSAGAVERELARLEARGPSTAQVDALWGALEALDPWADAARPLRRVLEVGLLEKVTPDLLLVEGGPLRGELEVRLLGELLARVRARGGEVHAVCLDLPPVAGPRGRLLGVLRAGMTV